jgi:hypothetical protein
LFRDVVRCVPNDFVGGHTLAAVRCPTGLLFDLDGQVCDWANRVNNCDKLTKPRNARPNFKTQARGRETETSVVKIQSY